MAEKYYLTINGDILEFCRLNEIDDIKKFAKKCIERGFTIEKYGETPSSINGEPKIIEKEVEVIKEVPVEVIKYVDKEIIKEVEVPVEVIREVKVPVETIKEVIKEVPVDKIVEVDKEVIVYREKPVEVVKEVEKIVEKEVPVEKIKEIEVIKEVYITDDSEVNELGRKIAKLEEEKRDLSQKLTEFVTKPPTIIEKEVPVEKIKIVEKEVPVEIIKEVVVEKPVPYEVVVEKIVEKPVEVIKEKIIEVRNEEELNSLRLEKEELLDTISKYDKMFAKLESGLNNKRRRDNLYDD